MTIICAMRAPATGRIWAGSDTLITEDDMRYHDCGPKWDFYNGWGIGASGFLRVVNVVQSSLAELFEPWPDIHAPVTAKVVADRIRVRVKADNLAGEMEPTLPAHATRGGETESGRDRSPEMLLTDGSGIWIIGSDYSVLAAREFAAVGAGAKFAYGAYYAIMASQLSFEPLVALRSIIGAACHYDPYCGGAPWVKEIKGG